LFPRATVRLGLLIVVLVAAGCGDAIGPTGPDPTVAPSVQSIHAPTAGTGGSHFTTDDLRVGMCLIEATKRSGEVVSIVRRLPRFGVPARKTTIARVAIGDRATSQQIASISCRIPDTDRAMDRIVRVLVPERLMGRAWPGIAAYRSGRGSTQPAGGPSGYIMRLEGDTSCDDMGPPPGYDGIWVCVDRDEICDEDENPAGDGWWEDPWSEECVCLESGWCNGDDPFGDDPDDDGPGDGPGGGGGGDGPPPPDPDSTVVEAVEFEIPDEMLMLPDTINCASPPTPANAYSRQYVKAYCASVLPSGPQAQQINAALNRIKARGGMCATLANAGIALMQGTAKIRVFPSGTSGTGSIEGGGDQKQEYPFISDFLLNMNLPAGQYGIVPTATFNGNPIRVNLEWQLVHELDHWVNNAGHVSGSSGLLTPNHQCDGLQR